MNKYQFKTNINCSGCVAKVTPALEKLEGIVSWEVDINNPSKILTVEGDDNLSAKAVSDAVKTVGFNIEQE